MKEKHRRTRRIDALEGATDWSDAEALLLALGAEGYEGGGSTVTFVLGGRKLTVDRPHPRRECGIGLVKRLRRFLTETDEDTTP